MLVQEVSIKPCSSGFGEYEVGEMGEVIDVSDILNEVEGEVYELGVSALPDSVSDIRGLIHNEPSRVFCLVNGDRVQYFGLESAE
jgi:hypothetical protein